MFFKYNLVMRGAGQRGAQQAQWAAEEFRKVCMGNRYSTTISVINSAIIKLSKDTAVSKARRRLHAPCALPLDLPRMARPCARPRDLHAISPLAGLPRRLGLRAAQDAHNAQRVQRHR